MFWENFLNICKSKGVTPNATCKELGFSSAAATHWKRGSLPNTDALIKIADYFNVSADYLLGRSSQISGTDTNNKIISNSSSQIINGDNNISSSIVSAPPSTAPIENQDVWAAYSELSTKDKLEIQLEILKRKDG